MIVDECRVARDPLKMVQHLTAEEGCSGKDKTYNIILTLNKQVSSQLGIDIYGQMSAFLSVKKLQV